MLDEALGPPQEQLNMAHYRSTNEPHASSFQQFQPPTAASAMVLPPADEEVHMRPDTMMMNAAKMSSHPSAVADPTVSLALLTGIPKGLSSEIGRTRSLYPVRFWILDNSGSMMNNDGTSIRGGASVACTRWSELQECVNFHAQLAGSLRATCVFRMLNDPGVRCGPQEFMVAETEKNIEEEVAAARKIMQLSKPYGSTPLTEHVLEIGRRIAVMAEEMKLKGLEAVVVIATDGLPTSSSGLTSPEAQQDFIMALRQLQALPVWIVVRLCTDEQDVVDFYNELDGALELPLEVLDDFFNEAKEIYQFNRWLNYTMHLHRCREMGYQHRLFDLLDERPLNKDEVKEFCTIVFGADEFSRAPCVHSDWNGFVKFVANIVRLQAPQYNPITKKLGSWIDTKELKRSFSSRSGVLGLFRKKQKGNVSGANNDTRISNR